MKKQKSNFAKALFGDKSNKKVQRIFPIAIRIVLLLGIVFLSVYTFTIIQDSDGFVDNVSTNSALNMFDNDINKANELANSHYDNLYEIENKLQNVTSSDEVFEITKEYGEKEDPRFGDLRIFNKGKVYSANGKEINLDLNNKIDKILHDLSNSNDKACSEVFYDNTISKECISFYVPVRGSSYVDGIASIVEVRQLIDTRQVLNISEAEIVLVIGSDGKVYCQNSLADSKHNIGNNFYTFINDITYSDVEVFNRVQQVITSNNKSACFLNAATDDYIITASPLSSFDNHLVLVSVYPSKGFVASELDYIRQVLILSIIAMVALFIGAINAALFYKRTRNQLENAMTLDPMVGCPNIEQFKTTASNMIQYQQNEFSLLILEMRQYSYLSEKLKEEDLIDILQYISKVLDTFCGVKETYGYMGNGKFVLLLKVTSDKEISERIALVESITGKHAILSGSKAKRKFAVGVSILKGSRNSINEHIIRATEALEKALKDFNSPYVLFDTKINKERDNREKVEAEMETALANGDFKVFYQPKLNIAADKLDSAEALVRWYDPNKGDYRYPNEFISLFEANGFIVKLDHFVYIKTLEFVSSAIKKGEKIVPISVNVSMVTVNQPDFLDYYIDNKRNYHVGDNYITLEFTESFSMENYDRIYEIVSKLHQFGIKVSLDDFGTGHSTLGVLKNIPFDELKFDRMFLRPGLSEKRDENMLSTLISFSKTIGIKTVLEGVENKELFDKASEHGIDVIQGYYYAKAIPLEEFKLFINSNTSIKYKSLVK